MAAASAMPLSFVHSCNALKLRCFEKNSMSNVDRSKTIEEIEGDIWGEPGYSSHLVTAIHALRRKPLQEFTVEDIRITLGQNLSVPLLMPLALEKLAINPLAQGDFYPGDLLIAISRNDVSDMKLNDQGKQMLKAATERAIEMLDSAPSEHLDFDGQIRISLKSFLTRLS
jgi:hypothetical protein